MAYEEPGLAQRIVDGFATRVLLTKHYRAFVEGMGLRGDERFLEVGPGAGAATKYLLAALPRGRVVCVDTSANWLEYVRKRHGDAPNLELLHGTLQAASLEASSFDAALVHWMLHDVEAADRAAFVGEIARLLRPGGRLFLREPTGGHHGMAPQLVRDLMAGAGLTETDPSEGKLRLTGAWFAATYRKPSV
jgi:ubiquinone/menaquinone biosynthesis C-methylase UbiE